MPSKTLASYIYLCFCHTYPPNLKKYIKHRQTSDYHQSVFHNFHTFIVSDRVLIIYLFLASLLTPVEKQKLKKKWKSVQSQRIRSFLKIFSKIFLFNFSELFWNFQLLHIKPTELENFISMKRQLNCWMRKLGLAESQTFQQKTSHLSFVIFHRHWFVSFDIERSKIVKFWR